MIAARRTERQGKSTPYSSGTFSLYTPGNPTVSGTTIASSWANNTLNDIATGLSTCILKDGSQTVTANIPMNNNKFTGLAAGSAAGNSVRYEQVYTTTALTDAATISWDTSLAPVATVTLGGSRTMAAPTNQKAGALYGLIVTQDGTGGRTLTWNAVFKAFGGGTMPQPETTLSTVSVFVFFSDGTNMYCLQCVPFIDTNYIVRGSSDPTKKVRFEVDGLTTATTRVITVPDADLTLPTLATQSDQETGTSTTTWVSPGRQQYHPSASKGWLECDSSGNISRSYNVTSISDDATGQVSVVWTVNESSANYCVICTAFAAGTALFCRLSAIATTGVTVVCTNTVPANADPTAYMIASFGDL